MSVDSTSLTSPLTTDDSSLTSAPVVGAAAFEQDDHQSLLKQVDHSRVTDGTVNTPSKSDSFCSRKVIISGCICFIMFIVLIVMAVLVLGPRSHNDDQQNIPNSNLKPLTLNDIFNNTLFPSSTYLPPLLPISPDSYHVQSSSNEQQQQQQNISTLVDGFVQIDRKTGDFLYYELKTPNTSTTFLTFQQLNAAWNKLLMQAEHPPTQVYTAAASSSSSHSHHAHRPPLSATTTSPVASSPMHKHGAQKKMRVHQSQQHNDAGTFSTSKFQSNYILQEPHTHVETTQTNTQNSTFTYSDYAINSKRSHILFSFSSFSLFRHSTLSRYAIYSLSSQTFTLLGTSPIRSVKWSPCGTMISYVLANDLFLHDVATQTDRRITFTGEATAGTSEDILNGVMDWVYEEEIFSDSHANWFAPLETTTAPQQTQPSQFLAYLTFNQSQVSLSTIKFFLPPWINMNTSSTSNILQEYSYHYPLPGQVNSQVELSIYSVSTSTIIFTFNQQTLNVLPFEYFVNVVWLNENTLTIRTSNRLQNEWHLYTVSLQDINNIHVTRSFSTTSPFYIEPHNSLVPLSCRIGTWLNIGFSASMLVENPFTHVNKFQQIREDLIVDVQPKFDDDNMHVVLYNATSGQKLTWLTSGDYSVVRILSYDCSHQLLYVIREVNIISSQVVAIDLSKLLSSLSTSNYKNWNPSSSSSSAAAAAVNQVFVPSMDLVHSIYPKLSQQALLPLNPSQLDLLLTYQMNSIVSPSGLFFLRNDLAKVPLSDVWSMSNFVLNPLNNTPEYLYLLKDNFKLSAILSEYALPTTTYVNFSSNIINTRTGSAYPMPGYRWTPQGFDENDCSKQYPVVFYVYGGPGFQNVLSSLQYSPSNPLSFAASLTSSDNFITYVIDPIGSGGGSLSYIQNYTYTQLGLKETESFFYAVTNSVQKLCYVDSTKLHLFGWSFGGFFSATAAASTLNQQMMNQSVTQPLFRQVIAIAPVTDWRLYDSVYTERYMQTPNINGHGYNISSVLLNSWRMTDDTFTVIDGTADDNVHFENSALLSDSLIQAGVSYRSMYYPNRAHSLLKWDREVVFDPAKRVDAAHDERHLYRILKDQFTTTRVYITVP